MLKIIKRNLLRRNAHFIINASYKIDPPSSGHKTPMVLMYMIIIYL
ncbi:MAG: hypothetical protein FWE21_04895 [Defluviitaleaceae bacterium]|nr:hypothetical protein [Defluviitaleaceae bacterium]